MRLPWLVIALLSGDASAPVARQSGVEDWRAQEYATLQEVEPVVRARGLALVYARAGFPTAAWDAAQRGLRSAPDDLALQFHAATSALQLSEASLARQHVDALRAELVRAELTEDLRSEWEASLSELLRNAEDLEKDARSRDRAVSLARWIAIAVLCGAMFALYRLSRGAMAGQGARSGTPGRRAT